MPSPPESPLLLNIIYRNPVLKLYLTKQSNTCLIPWAEQYNLQVFLFRLKDIKTYFNKIILRKITICFRIRPKKLAKTEEEEKILNLNSCIRQYITIQLLEDLRLFSFTSDNKLIIPFPSFLQCCLGVKSR